MRGGKQPRITGQTLKLVATRAAPHTVVGVHIFGDDACELVHFGTTLVQAQKTLDKVNEMGGMIKAFDARTAQDVSPLWTAFAGVKTPSRLRSKRGGRLRQCAGRLTRSARSSPN